MRRALVVMLVAGCNQLFHIDDTNPNPPDAPIDADLFSCDPLPTFTTAPTFAGSGIVGFAIDLDGQLEVGTRLSDGAVCQADSHSQLAPSMFVESIPTTHTHPRLAPAGNEMTVLAYDAMINATALTSYLASARDVWNFEGTNTMPVAVTADTLFSEPTKGAAQRQIIVFDKGTFLEFAQQATGSSVVIPWSFVSHKHSYQPVDLGVEAMTEPSMSADGKRLVFRGTSGGHDDVYLTTRDSLDADFPAAHVLYATPDDQTELTPFMTPDCGRLYFTLGSDLYYVTY
ncbi:MAG TPA: hypothetical protein VGO00_05620 [Kofleriaceae bacterium]|nr:hypothetical protein [Kofleriaceae bacterium]